MENNKNINNENEIDFDYGWEQQKEPDRLDEINVVRAIKAKKILEDKIKEENEKKDPFTILMLLYFLFPIIVLILYPVVIFLIKVFDFAKNYFF